VPPEKWRGGDDSGGEQGGRVAAAEEETRERGRRGKRGSEVRVPHGDGVGVLCRGRVVGGGVRKCGSGVFVKRHQLLLRVEIHFSTRVKVKMF
jgi:hypothetical protein